MPEKLRSLADLVIDGEPYSIDCDIDRLTLDAAKAINGIADGMGEND